MILNRFHLEKDICVLLSISFGMRATLLENFKSKTKMDYLKKISLKVKFFVVTFIMMNF